MRDILFPKICPLCHEEICAPDGEACQACQDKLPMMPERTCPGCGGPNDGILELCSECISVKGGRPWEHAVSAYPFHGEIRTAIHEFKYRGRKRLLPLLARSLAEAWRLRGGDRRVDAVTYIPLHFLRYFFRGYNQSELLAKVICRELGIPMWGDALIKPQDTASMRLSTGIERRNMLQGAFTVPEKACGKVSGADILLVDDVVTTGSTADACAIALKDAGARSVSVLCFASSARAFEENETE